MSVFRDSVSWLLMALSMTMLASAHVQARVTRIVIDETVSPAFCRGDACRSYGAAGQYEQLAGRQHAGYVEAVRKAVAKVQAAGFLLEADGAALVKEAEAGNVLR